MPPEAPLGALVARQVVGVALVHDEVARLPLVLDEPVRPGADRLLDLLVGIGGGEPRGHDEDALAEGLPSASSTRPNGCSSSSTNVFLSTA